MAIEEKAKAYDEAYKKVAVRFGSNVADEIFLKESEGERIRKALKQYFINSFQNNGVAAICGVHIKDVLAWLEKQGEHAKFRDSIQVGDKVTRNQDGMLVNLSQLKRVAKPAENKGEHDMGISEATKKELEDNLNKALEKETPESLNKFLDEQNPADKVEPKFKIGDFIVNDYCMGRVVEITNDAYLLDTEQGIPFSCHSTRLWDITKDAKDGDVLYNKDDFSGNSVFIYKDISDKTHACLYYTRLFRDKDFCIPNDVMWENGVGVNGGEFYPATKEQRDLLFQKMKEAGYTFDFEKKELKKIVQKPADTEKEAKGNEREIPNSSWSEEDENTRNNINHIIRQYDKISKRNNQPCWYVGDSLLWMQNIKGRVKQQPKPEWSEKDEGMLKTAINRLELSKNRNASEIPYVERCVEWLKSLRERYTWKPSDEQMKALDRAQAELCSTEYNKPICDLIDILNKLRGE